MRSLISQFNVYLIILLPVLCVSILSPAQDPKSTVETIKIGLLVPDSKSPAARYGAELAIKTANEKGGIHGVPVSLVVSTMEGPWGTGSKEAVTMIFDQNVTAILGSHDGRNAHLVEQVAAKARVVFLSAWSADPTLAQAFVPWFFNCVYNDNQVSDALIDEIYNKRRMNKLAAISDNSYDSGSALRNFLKKAENAGKPKPLQVICNVTINDFKDLPQKLKDEGVDCIINLVQAPVFLEITEQLKLSHLNLPVYCTLNQLDENKIPDTDLRRYENARIVSSVNLTTKQGSVFCEEYKKTYGNSPGAVASYAYDGMNILIEAIIRAGTDRELIQKAIRDIKYEGVTGTIQFDENGNRKGTPVFVEIKNGIPVSLK